MPKNSGRIRGRTRRWLEGGSFPGPRSLLRTSTTPTTGPDATGRAAIDRPVARSDRAVLGRLGPTGCGTRLLGPVLFWTEETRNERSSQRAVAFGGPNSASGGTAPRFRTERCPTRCRSVSEANSFGRGFATSASSTRASPGAEPDEVECTALSFEAVAGRAAAGHRVRPAEEQKAPDRPRRAVDGARGPLSPGASPTSQTRRKVVVGSSSNGRRTAPRRRRNGVRANRDLPPRPGRPRFGGLTRPEKLQRPVRSRPGAERTVRPSGPNRWQASGGIWTRSRSPAATGTSPPLRTVSGPDSVSTCR